MKKFLKFIDIVALNYLAVFLLVFLAAGFSQDVLLFISDPYSIAVFLSGLSLLILSVLMIPLSLILIRVATETREKWVRRLSVLLFSLIVFTALMHWLDTGVIFNYSLDVLNEALPFDSKIGVFVLVSGVLFLLCMLLAGRVARRVSLSDRILIVSRTALAGALVLFLVSIFSARFSSPSTEEPRQNVILIILDGLSTKYLEPYQSTEQTPDFKALAERSVQYTNIRTNFTYTHDYFRVLYSGDKMDRGLEVAKPVNLLSLLQEAGVNTRWITYHNNGVPDVQKYAYKGLRSFYLVQDLAWIPRLLGLDYNVFRLDGGGWRGRYYSYREAALKQWMIQMRESPNYFPLETSFPREVESLRQGSRPFFALLHLPVFAFTGEDSKMKHWELEKEKVASGDTLNRIKKKILIQQDWTARQEDEEAMKVYREQYRQDVRRGTQSLKKFMDLFFQKQWDRDTLVIVTADHGQIFTKGKYGYGFHHEEEVARVPFLVFWKGQRGVDDRLGETIDLSQTLLELFGVEKKLSPDALSLLGDRKKSSVSTLTRRSGKRHEWFMNVYKGDRRYVFNLEPGRFAARREKFDDYFNTSVEQEGKPALDEMKAEVQALVTRYGLDKRKVAPEIWK